MRPWIALLLLATFFAAPLTAADPYRDRLRGDRFQVWDRQTVAYDRAFGRVLSQLGNLEGKAAEYKGLSRDHLTSIRTNAHFLQVKWREWTQRQGPGKTYNSGSSKDEYLATLEAYSDVLETLRKRWRPEASPATLEQLARDLEIKAGNCRHSADGLGRTVEVKVRTLGASGEQGGWQVWCAPRFFMSTPRGHVRFSRESSPTRQLLAPGDYFLWLQRGNTRTEPVPQEIGGHGQTAAEVDLRTP